MAPNLILKISYRLVDIFLRSCDCKP